MENTHLLPGSTVKLWAMKMKKAVASLGSSFWFLPTMLIALALFFALYLFPYFSSYLVKPNLLNTLDIANPSTAMQVVQVVASSLMTVSSIVFSMTLVTLVMASNSFGPRIIRSFMQNKKTQFVLGFLSASFVYCLLVLSQIQVDAAQATLPVLSVFVTLVLAVLCVFVLIFFIHHVAVSIRADTVVEEIAKSLLLDMTRLQENHGRRESVELGQKPYERYEYQSAVSTRLMGYIEAIEYAQLAEVAAKYKGIIDMHTHAGKYIYPDSQVAVLYSNEALPDSICLDESIIIGTQRTPLQDPQFAINQLVEMALRALSPSMDDPFTAMTCIDKLTGALATFHEKNLPKTMVLDADLTARVLTNEETFDKLFAGAFTQIRQSSITQTAVLCHLLDVFYNLLIAKQDAEHLIHPISMQVRAIEQSLQAHNVLKNDADKKAVSERIRCITDRVNKQ
ncbi:MAG: DUF2254 domain-containing protein [Glaciecola sp.]